MVAGGRRRRRKRKKMGMGVGMDATQTQNCRTANPTKSRADKGFDNDDDDKGGSRVCYALLARQKEAGREG